MGNHTSWANTIGTNLCQFQWPCLSPTTLWNIASELIYTRLLFCVDEKLLWPFILIGCSYIWLHVVAFRGRGSGCGWCGNRCRLIYSSSFRRLSKPSLWEAWLGSPWLSVTVVSVIRPINVLFSSAFHRQRKYGWNRYPVMKIMHANYISTTTLEKKVKDLGM